LLIAHKGYRRTRLREGRALILKNGQHGSLIVGEGEMRKDLGIQKPEERERAKAEVCKEKGRGERGYAILVQFLY